MSIQTEITRLQTAKADIKTAIELKGVNVPSSATIDTYDDYVSQIVTGGGGSSSAETALAGMIDGSLTEIIIPEGITNIRQQAFDGCHSLSSATIPDSVTSISDLAFYGCSALQYIICLPTTPPSLGIMALEQTNDCPIMVPVQLVTAYQSAWSDYASRIQAIPE